MSESLALLCLTAVAFCEVADIQTLATPQWERSQIDVTVSTDYKRVQMRECSIHLLPDSVPGTVVRDRAIRRSVVTGMPVSAGGEKP